MKNGAWRTLLFSLFIVATVSSSSFSAVPSEKFQKENKIKSVVQDVFREHGYSIEKNNVVLIEEDGKLTVAMDVSRSIASDLSDDVLDRIVALDLSLLDTTLEMNIFGAAVGVREGDNRKNAIAPNWEDALSTVGREVRFEKDDRDGVVSSPAMITTDGFWSAPQNSALEKARSIILAHLLKIRESGQMFSTVLMENYWKEVFSQAEASDLYETGRPLISEALAAGVKPYRENGTLNASLFADLAMGALGLQPVQGSGASVILFRP